MTLGSLPASCFGNLSNRRANMSKNNTRMTHGTHTAKATHQIASSGAAWEEMTCSDAMLPVKLKRMTIHCTHCRAVSPNITLTSCW